MNALKLLLLFVSLGSFGVSAQTPCGTNFTGFDPCSAELLGTANTCAAASETFQTNTCAGTLPATGGCAMTSGANIVWGVFTVATTDTYTITWTASNNRNIRLGLYQFTDACLMSGETQVACSNAGGVGVDETISQVLTPGTYYVCGKSSGNLSAASTICVHAPNIPAPIVASDCGVGVNVCTNLSFAIDPNGEGTNTTEIPPSGSTGNPLYDGFSTFNPWGTLNMGCLQIVESNSTWMKVNISGSGDLEFIFGGNSTQAGFYDWIMYPASSDCADILAYSDDPIRCNWNMVDYGGTGLKDVTPSGGDAGNFEPSIPVLAGEVYIICFSNYSSIQTSVPLEFGGTANVSCTPLPVEFTSLAARYQEGTSSEVKVAWSTVSEKNNDYFQVERSIDNINFDKVDVINGAGNSNEMQNYNIIDEAAIQGEINYYRIKQVDFDGKEEFSNIVSAFVPVQTIAIYPNPSSGQVTMNFENVEGSITVILRDMTGRIVDERYYSVHDGSIQSDYSNIPSGTYMIDVCNERVRLTHNRVVFE